MNILIAEDDIIQRELLSEMLESKYIDIRIYVAATENECMEIIDDKEIDLFFMDINLKDSSGLKLTEKIRKINKYELTPIVFITGELGYLIDAFKKVHCYDYIMKPYDISCITSIVDKFGKYSSGKNKDTSCTYFKIDDVIQVRVYHEEIIFIEYYLKKCMIHTLNEVYNIKSRGLKNTLEEINCSNIVRTHRSYAVNKKHIRNIEKINSKSWEIMFRDYNKKAELSYSYKDNIEDMK
jgi:DNA-binding LytR/AlgR family response regulator